MVRPKIKTACKVGLNYQCIPTRDDGKPIRRGRFGKLKKSGSTVSLNIRKT